LADEMQQVLGRRDFLLVDQDVAVLQDALHLGEVRDEVGAQVALVELHALHELDLGLERLAFLDGDHAVLAHLVHRLGDDLADLLILVGGAGADLAAMSMPRLIWLALAPTVMFLSPSVKMASA
jgi:hypothetical protein